MTLFFVTIALVIILIGLDKGGLGGTLGVLITPLMTLILPPQQVIGLLLPILMLGDVFAVTSHWRKWDSQLVILLIPGGVIGTILATMWLQTISADTLRDILGAIILLFVLYKLNEFRFSQVTYTPRAWHSLVAGTLAGLSSTLAHVGGPPIVIYLLLVRVPPQTFVATAALFFAIINWFKVPAYLYLGLLDAHRLTEIAWLLPLLPVSVWLGKSLAQQVNKVIFDRMVTVLLIISALFLLLE